MSDLPVEGKTISEDNVAHFDLDIAVEIENQPLEAVASEPETTEEPEEDKE